MNTTKIIAAKEAKYARVKRAVMKRIALGGFSPAGLLPSDRELMRELGVCQQTIIRALRDLSAEGIVRREHGKGTFVNLQKTRSEVGILTYLDQTTPIHSVYSQNWLCSVVNHLCEAGYEPQLYSTYGTDVIGDIHAHGQQVFDHCARGRLCCLVTASSYIAGDVEQAVTKWGVHVIGSHTEEMADLGTYNVGGDFEAVTAEGVRHLLKRGFRKIAIITGKQIYASSSNRVEAYMRVLEENRLSIRPGWIHVDLPPSPQAGYEQFQRLWTMDERPEAVMILDDFMALGATRAIAELGVATPRDLTVLIMMNQGSGLVFPVPVVTMEVACAPVGAAVAEMVGQLLRGEAVAQPHRWVKPAIRIYEAAGLESMATSPSPVPEASVSV